MKELEPDERGRASDYIKHAPNELQPCDLVILCCRVSTCTQDHDGNLQNQVANLTDRAKHFGVEILDVVQYVGSGTEPLWLFRGAEYAKRHGAKLFAETTDRFIRHPDYHSIANPNAQAGEPELQLLKRCTRGVTLVTDLDPNASPSKVQSYHRKRGQKFKESYGGRPHKQPCKDRKKAWLPMARKLRALGFSNGRIAEWLNRLADGSFDAVCTETVRNWLQDFAK
jgi:hypothetical protein